MQRNLRLQNIDIGWKNFNLVYARINVSQTDTSTDIEEDVCLFLLIFFNFLFGVFISSFYFCA